MDRERELMEIVKGLIGIVDSLLDRVDKLEKEV